MRAVKFLTYSADKEARMAKRTRKTKTPEQLEGERSCTHDPEQYKLLGPDSTMEYEIMFCPMCKTLSRSGKLREGRLFRIKYTDIESLAPLSFIPALFRGGINED